VRAWLGAAACVAVFAFATSARAQDAGDAADAGDASRTADGAAPSGDDDASEVPTASAGTSSSDSGTADAADGTGEGDEEGSSEDTVDAGTEPPPPQITDEQRRIMRPSLGTVSQRDDSGSGRFILPPLYMSEWGRGHDTTVVFPLLYFNVGRRNERGIVVGPYYQFRSPTQQTDAVLPFYFHFRGRDGATRWNTDVVFNTFVHSSTGPGRSHATSFGSAPFVFYGEQFGSNGLLSNEHLFIPPLLTFHRWWPTGQTTIVGPVVYARNGSETNLVGGPVVIHHRDTQQSWTVIPPLLTFHREDLVENRSFTLVGPLILETTPTSTSYNFAPVFFHWHDRTNARTTFAPLFHTETGPDRFTLVTPLGGYARNGRETTLVLPFYQNHRGTTQLDAIAPLGFAFQDPRRGVSSFGFLPGFVHSSSPTGYGWGLFPFMARLHEYGRYDTTATPLFVHSNSMETRSSVTWVFPTFHHEQSPTSWAFNIYPLWYSAGGREWHHTVFFPFFGDVGNRTQGTGTFVSPLFARVTTRANTTSWIPPFNFWWEGTQHGERYNGLDAAPFFQYERRAQSSERWSVFYGLVGWRRQGSFEQLQLFWIPIDLRGHPPSQTPPASQRASNGDVRMEL